MSPKSCHLHCRILLPVALETTCVTTRLRRFFCTFVHKFCDIFCEYCVSIEHQDATFPLILVCLGTFLSQRSHRNVEILGNRNHLIILLALLSSASLGSSWENIGSHVLCGESSRESKNQ